MSGQPACFSETYTLGYKGTDKFATDLSTYHKVGNNNKYGVLLNTVMRRETGMMPASKFMRNTRNQLYNSKLRKFKLNEGIPVRSFLDHQPKDIIDINEKEMYKFGLPVKLCELKGIPDDEKILCRLNLTDPIRVAEENPTEPILSLIVLTSLGRVLCYNYKTMEIVKQYRLPKNFSYTNSKLEWNNYGIDFYAVGYKTASKKGSIALFSYYPIKLKCCFTIEDRHFDNVHHLQLTRNCLIFHRGSTAELYNFDRVYANCSPVVDENFLSKGETLIAENLKWTRSYKPVHIFKFHKMLKSDAIFLNDQLLMFLSKVPSNSLCFRDISIPNKFHYKYKTVPHRPLISPPDALLQYELLSIATDNSLRVFTSYRNAINCYDLSGPPPLPGQTSGFTPTWSVKLDPFKNPDAEKYFISPLLEAEFPNCEVSTLELIDNDLIIATVEYFLTTDLRTKHWKPVLYTIDAFTGNILDISALSMRNGRGYNEKFVSVSGFDCILSCVQAMPKTRPLVNVYNLEEPAQHDPNAYLNRRQLRLNRKNDERGRE